MIPAKPLKIKHFSFAVLNLTFHSAFSEIQSCHTQYEYKPHVLNRTIIFRLHRRHIRHILIKTNFIPDYCQR